MRSRRDGFASREVALPGRANIRALMKLLDRWRAATELSRQANRSTLLRGLLAASAGGAKPPRGHHALGGLAGGSGRGSGNPISS